MLNVFLSIFFLVFVFYYDTQYQLIPNWVNGGFWIAALFLSFMKGGDSFMISLLSGVIGLLLLLIPYAFGWVGGGDVKMLGALGSLMGTAFLVKTLCYGLIVSGIFSLLLLLQHGGITRLVNAVRFVWPLKKEKNKYILIDKSIPLGSCISIVGIALLLFQNGGGLL